MTSSKKTLKFFREISLFWLIIYIGGNLGKAR